MFDYYYILLYIMEMSKKRLYTITEKMKAIKLADTTSNYNTANTIDFTLNQSGNGEQIRKNSSRSRILIWNAHLEEFSGILLTRIIPIH